MLGQNARRGAGQQLRVHGKQEGASFQVIVLGSSGGPREDNVTGLLVRAPQSEWHKGSMIAVDAGSHLANIIRILESSMPLNSEALPPLGYSKLLEEGPFAGVTFPHLSAKANSLYVFREILHSFLITHPHLDHLSGMAINTPALEYGREAKEIVALPSTIEAIKNHIFNDWLWPNLSDEGNGVGFVTYRRLIEGGNPRLGSGESRGYVNVCDGLATKCWSVSHGRCHRRKPSLSHQHSDSFGWNPSDYNFPSRRMSRISDDHGYFAAVSQQQSQNAGAYPAGAAQMSMSAGPGTPGASGVPPIPGHVDANHMFEPVSSSAFFIRNDVTGEEILIFGDVEPDLLSMSPRNYIVWEDAAAKVVDGYLKAIFIECSYDDSVLNEDLYGHLCPRHLIAELLFLANSVMNRRKQRTSESNPAVGDQGSDAVVNPVESAAVSNMSMRQPPTPADLKRKRKRPLNGDLAATPDLASIPSELPPQLLPSVHVGHRSVSVSRRKTSREPAAPSPTPIRGRAVQFQATPSSPSAVLASGTQATLGASASLSTAVVSVSELQPQAGTLPREKLPEPLKGLTVHIIHVKDNLMDGPSPGVIIASQLRAQSEEVGLGVDFYVTSCGDSIWI